MCQLPIGVLLDRFGIRRIGRISTFLWSLASFGAAITPSIGGFFAARFLLGVGEAPTFPANAKAIGHWFPSKERSFATALFDSAAKFASAIGVPIIGIILIKVGWRLSFAATGVISFAYFLLFWSIYREPQDDPKLTLAERSHIAEHIEPDPDEVIQPPATLGYLLRQRKVLGLAIGFGSYNYVFYLLLTWLPSYLSAALHIDLLHSFLYTGLPWLFATFTDLSAGLLADSLIHRGYDASRVRKTIIVIGTAFGLGIFGAAGAHTATRARSSGSAHVDRRTFLAASPTIGWSVPSMIAPRGSTGTVGGIVNFSNQLSGIAAPIITGYVVAYTHSYAWAFGIPTIYLLIGIASYIFLLGRIEQIPQEPLAA